MCRGVRSKNLTPLIILAKANKEHEDQNPKNFG